MFQVLSCITEAVLVMQLRTATQSIGAADLAQDFKQRKKYSTELVPRWEHAVDVSRNMSYPNGTALAAGPGNQHEATGQDIFWAMLALALSTMAQQSITVGTLLNSAEVFGGPLTPHLSSPIWCLADMVLEASILARSALNYCGLKSSPRSTSLPGGSITQQEAASRDKSTRGAIATRIGLIVLGVIPQAITIFAMRGIPVLQAIAASFLATSIVRGVSVLAARFCRDERESVETWLHSNDAKIGSLRLMTCMLAGHIVAYAFVWHFTATSISVCGTIAMLQFAVICQKIAFGVNCLLILLVFVWAAGVFTMIPWLYQLWRPQVSPMFMSMALTHILRYPTEVLRHHKNCTWDTVLWISFPPAAAAGLLSYGIAWGLVCSTKWVNGELATVQHEDHPLTPLPGAGVELRVVTTGAEEVAPSTATSARATEDDGDGGDAALDNHVSNMLVYGLLFAYIGGSTDSARDAAPDPPEDTGSPATADHAATAPAVEAGTGTQHIEQRTNRRRRRSRRRIQYPNASGEYAYWFRVAYAFKNFRGTVVPALAETWQMKREGRTISFPQRIRTTLFFAGIACVLFCLQTLVFIFMVFMNLADFKPYFRFASRRVSKMEAEEKWIAFAVFNLFTLAGYCFVTFDGAGTLNPKWTDLLGRR